jgi:mannose/fructose/N-acetylgalactosamine-specific phosphotransferase system component IIB
VVDQDIDVFKELNAKGVHLIAQMVPSDNWRT